jgi:hypothetical protein
MKRIAIISVLLLIGFNGLGKNDRIKSLLIGRWIVVKDTGDDSHYPKLNLEIEYKSNREFIEYQAGKIISSGKWKLANKRIKKSIFLINYILILKQTKDKFVKLVFECNDYKHNCPNKSCYKTTYKKLK